MRSSAWPTRQVCRGLALAWIAAAAAMPKLRTKLGIPRAVALGVVAGGPGAVAVALPRGRPRQYAVFLAQMWAYLRAFELTYAHPEKLRRRLRVDYPIAVDRALGLGTPPGVRLQGLRRRWPRVRWVLDRALGLAYFAWALERHAVLIYLIVKHPERFARSAALVAASFDLGWMIFSAVPTAPPWWAAKQGHLDGLHRVTVEAGYAVPLAPVENESDDDQGNPWASMPSTHTASAVMVALVAADADPRAGALAGAYAGVLGLALVYLGEHYLADVLAGAALAVAIHAAEPSVSRLLRVAVWARRPRALALR